jgi:hypothetical protein
MLDEELDDEIAVIRGEIWDNCRDWCYKCDILIPDNEVDRKIERCPKCKRLMGFIPKQGIDEYLKTLDPEEREAREKGLWKHLSGLVYKDFDVSTHGYEDFRIPQNWMKIEAVDPHDARATHWLFGAVSPEEIEIFGKTRYRIYFFDALLLKGSIEDMTRTVKSVRELHGYSEPKWVVLDAKYGAREQLKVGKDEPRSWQSELERNGINRIRLSHSNPGDVQLGHKVVKEYLKSQYSKLTGLTKPGMMFATKNCGGRGKPIHFMTNYQYKEDADKPEEQYKDWPDCIRYIALEQPIYVSPENVRDMTENLTSRMERAKELRRHG